MASDMAKKINLKEALFNKIWIFRSCNFSSYKKENIYVAIMLPVKWQKGQKIGKIRNKNDFFFQTFFQKVVRFEIWLHLDMFSSLFLFKKCHLGCKNVNFENNDNLFYLFFNLNHQKTSQDWYRVTQMLFLSLGQQEIKIAIWGRVLLCSWFYVVNLPLGKFAAHGCQGCQSFLVGVKGR